MTGLLIAATCGGFGTLMIKGGRHTGSTKLVTFGGCLWLIAVGIVGVMVMDAK